VTTRHRFRGWLLTLLFIPALSFGQGKSFEATIQEMAQRIAGAIPPDTPVSLTFRNLGGPLHVWSELQRGLEGELARQRIDIGESGAGQQVRVTFSDSLRGLLLVAEIPGQDTNAVIILPLPRDAASANAARSNRRVEIKAELLIERAEPILDVLSQAEEILVLGTSSVSVYKRGAIAGTPKEIPFDLPTTLPRDPRGRILPDQAGAISLLFPGSRCTGTTAQGFACYANEDLWPLTADGRLRARLVPGRNYFDAVSIDLKEASTVASFFSAARMGEGPGSLVLTSGTDGTTRIYDSSVLITGSNRLFRSDFVAIPGTCGPILLQTGEEEADSVVEALEVDNQQPAPIGNAVRLPGAVTGAWPSIGNKATVVSRDPVSGRYLAYILEVLCFGRGFDAATP